VDRAWHRVVGLLAVLLAGLVAVMALGVLYAAAPAAAASGSWSDRLSDLTGAGPLAGNGRGVTVAVLDTWVDNVHPDFGNRVSAGVTCSGGSCVPGGNQPDTAPTSPGSSRPSATGWHQKRRCYRSGC
jgi:subtilisin family serine protease